MALSALPAEILSRICRFIILEDPPFSSKLPRDVKLLRLSCKKVYEKTLFDSAICYGGLLDHLMVAPTYKSLGRLLSISSAPYFRDRLREITFYMPFLGYTRSYDAGYARIFDREELVHFPNSPDAIYILTESFKNLANLTSLLKVHLCEELTYPVVFNALNLAAFPRQIIHVVVIPACFRQSPHKRFLNPLSESLHLISHIEIEATPHPDPGEEESNWRRSYAAHNETGRYYSHYKSVTPSLSDLAKKLSSVQQITLYGCDTVPRLRLCHGCEDIWLNLFAKNTYAHLNHFKLCESYVSGSRLRGFIKRHAGTLQRIEFKSVSLTDGTWRSIAQSLQKCPNLDYLDTGSDTSMGSCLSSLRQKHPAPALAVSLPEGYLDNKVEYVSGLQPNGFIWRVILRNRTDVVHWLDIFVRYFTTTECDLRQGLGADGYELPVYHKADAFSLSNPTAAFPDTRTRARKAMDRYLRR